jgi:hypothetical protein
MLPKAHCYHPQPRPNLGELLWPKAYFYHPQPRLQKAGSLHRLGPTNLLHPIHVCEGYIYNART